MFNCCCKNTGFDTTMGTVKEICSQDDLDFQLKTSDRLIVVYFTKGRNNNFDHNMYPPMAKNFTTTTFLRVDFSGSHNGGICQRYEVTEDPTFVFFKNQVEVMGERHLDWDAPNLEARIKSLVD
ncbi:uncharacterized protein LOC144436245 [Glandiceps talaboti]